MIPVTIRCGRQSAHRLHQRLAIVVSLALAAGLAACPAIAATPSDLMRQKLQHSGDVNDFARILAPADRAALEERCRILNQKTGAGFVVVILDSLEGGEINDFANRLFKQWGIGQKGKDNGLLLLVALRDHKARFEVGYGLEPILPDALAGRVLDQELFPAFRQQRYGDGLKAAVNRAAEIIERGQPAPPEARHREAAPMTLGQKFLMTLFLSLFVVIGSFMFGAGAGAKVGPLCLFGMMFGGFPYLIGYAIAFPVAPLLQSPLALLMIGLGYRSGRGKPGSFRGSGRRGYTDFNTWSWVGTGSGSSGSSWSSGGFSGSSGSFGGGSSGGGGASGSW